MNKNVIKKPKIYLYIGIPSFFFWLFVQIFACFKVKDGGALIAIPAFVFTPFVLAFLYLILLCLNWKIVFFENALIYTNFWKKKTKYNLNELTVIYKNPKRKGCAKFYLFFKNHKITTVTMFDINIKSLRKIKNHQIEIMKK